MRLGDGPEPENAANAYSSTGSMLSKRLWIIIGGILLLMIARNVVFNDYTGETRSYLQKVGKSEAADYIAPKTYSELRQEKLSRDMLFDQMLVNVTRLSANLPSLTTIPSPSTSTQSQQELMDKVTKLSEELESLKEELAEVKAAASSAAALAANAKKASSSSSSLSSKKSSSSDSSEVIKETKGKDKTEKLRGNRVAE